MVLKVHTTAIIRVCFYLKEKMWSNLERKYKITLFASLVAENFKSTF